MADLKQANSYPDPTSMQLRNTLRQTFRERRRRLSKDEQVQHAIALIKQCEASGLLASAQRVAVYKTNDGELDTQPLIDHLWQLGISVYLPVLHPFSDGHLLFVEYKEDSAMVVNGFGIPEPRLDCQAVCPLNNLDLLFTPLVAFDDAGNRLGMGGGFYDRTLVSIQGHKQQSTPIVIGLAHDIQKTLTLPTEAWDIPLKTIITPTTIYRF